MEKRQRDQNRDMEAVDLAMNETYQEIASRINQELQRRVESGQRPVLVVGIVGPPGAGKSTTADRLATIIPSSIVVPMDGFHYYKRELDMFPNRDEAYAKRGAHWTFNSERFVSSIASVKEQQFSSPLMLPSFDHCVGDPVEDDIVVSKDHSVVIVEGNYLLLRESPWNQLKAERLIDLFVFIDADVSTLRKRIILRHQGTGLSEEMAAHRADDNDLPNAMLILETKVDADMIVRTL